MSTNDAIRRMVPADASRRRLGLGLLASLSQDATATGPRVRAIGRHKRPREHPAARYLDRYGARFITFSGIGGAVFVAGFALQAVLTSVLHMPPMVSYIIQAVASIEASFVLNRWLTWRDRDTPIWQAFRRYNLQKTVTVGLNFVLYAGLLKLGLNYLIANILLTAVFTVVNFVAGDRLVFIPSKVKPEREPTLLPSVAPAQRAYRPPVSVVIPCRNNAPTIADTVLSLLDQDYPQLEEIILVGSPRDTTWNGLEGIENPRVLTWETETPPGVQDANFKRDLGIRGASSDLIALVDSDIVLPPTWMSNAVLALQSSGVACVTGGMKSIHDPRPASAGCCLVYRGMPNGSAIPPPGRFLLEGGLDPIGIYLRVRKCPHEQ